MKIQMVIQKARRVQGAQSRRGGWGMYNAIRRKKWGKKYWLLISTHDFDEICMVEGNCVWRDTGVYHKQAWQPRAEDIFADDWEVMSEVPPDGPIRKKTKT